MPKPRKRRDKAYRPRAVKDTTYLLTGREPPSQSDANTIKIVYSQIYERVLTGEGLQMLRDALDLNYRLIDHSSEYILKQIVRVLATRASTGQFKVAQTPITDAEMFVG